MARTRLIAVGCLTRRDLDVIGSGLQRAFPLPETEGFAALLSEIDRAECRAPTAKPVD